MQEQWSRWQPLDGLYAKYSMDLLMDSSKSGFTIELSVDELLNKVATQRRVCIVFEKSVYAYRVTDEGKRLKLLEYLSAHYLDDFYGRWTFFTVKHSSYLRWLSEESFESSYELQAKHYVLLCDNPIIEILSAYEPVVTYIV